MQTGAVVGIQDMGAAGLACSPSEMPARAGTGADVDLERVPAARDGHDAVRDPPLGVPGADAPRRGARPRGGGAADLPEVGAGRRRHRARDRRRGPARPHAGRGGGRGAGRGADRRRARLRPAPCPPGLAGPERRVRPADPARAGGSGRRAPAAPGLAHDRVEAKHLGRQYDQQVGINTLVLPGSDAAVLRIKGTRRAIAVSTDGNGRSGSSTRPRAARWRSRGGPQRRVRRRAAPRRHQLPELRLARAARDPVAVRRGHRGDRGGVPGARHAGGRRQRFLLQ